jgi:uncharacterized protein YecE (DUF72 family)
MPQLRIGTSGWVYDQWRASFYPPGLPQRAVLSYAAQRFNSLEVNGSFYSLQRPSTYQSWYAQTPPDFIFALKGSRFITHNKKLGDIAVPLANFFASGLLCLADKLGPIVWQLPATARFDAERLGAFFALLPRDTRAAARLALRHDGRVAGRSWTKPGRMRRIRHALEVRSERFFVPELVRLARRHDVALVVSDAAGWPRVEEMTASFAYLRLHGAERTYASGYDDRALDVWAARIARWACGGEPDDARRISDRPARRRAGRDVYVYFDNDFEANAPHDALRLAARLAHLLPKRIPHDEPRPQTSRRGTTHTDAARRRAAARGQTERRQTGRRSTV